MVRYVCVGEKCNRNCRNGYCGDVHTLPEWISILFGEEHRDYFNGWLNKDVLEYIKKNAGKRLKESK